MVADLDLLGEHPEHIVKVVVALVMLNSDGGTPGSGYVEPEPGPDLFVNRWCELPQHAHGLHPTAPPYLVER